MSAENSLNPKRINILLPYLTGFLTASVLSLLFSLFIAYTMGFANFFLKLKAQFVPQPPVLNLSQDVLAELTQLKAPIDNANNPTHVARHNTYLVRPEKSLGYELKPDVRLAVSMLKSARAINLDPPVLHLKKGLTYSNQLRAFLREQALLNYSYSTDSQGFRTTVPSVENDKKILIIGDSVPFGIGVDDEHTMASQLQKLIGERYQVINAGVGGYDGHQAFLAAKRLARDNAFSGLIYVACQNDFMKGDDWRSEAKNTIEEIGTISNKFNKKVIVILVTYMEYNLRDFFRSKGWSAQRITGTDVLRNYLPKISEQLGFEYYDWTDLVTDFMKKEKSIFSRFALYSDHAHLSPLGNRLVAAKLFSIMKRTWFSVSPKFTEGGPVSAGNTEDVGWPTLGFSDHRFLEKMAPPSEERGHEEEPIHRELDGLDPA